VTSHIIPVRARNLDEMSALRDKFSTEAGREAGLAFQPHPTDIIITPFAKSGTTWLQQIAHGLRTRGSMDFEEITEVTPWIEMAHDMGWDLEAEQVARPRLYKSHLSWHDVPKGGRYIYSIRNPFDVAVSYYRFLEGWWFERDSINIEEFTRERFTNDPENRGYWYHIASWWEQRKDENVLILCYEDMKADLPGTIKTVARFMGIPLDDDLFQIVLRQSSRAFMLAHQSHFDDHLIQQNFERNGGAPMDVNTAKVTPGANGEAKYQLSQGLRDEFDAIWRQMIYERFGLPDYAALRAAIGALRRL